IAQVPSFAFIDGEIAGRKTTFSRTGYTGEDGFEVFTAATDALKVWEVLLEAGQSYGAKPCGLGARDVLRLEAGLRRSGQDMDENTTPLEAGLSRFVKLDGDNFLGKAALQQQKSTGLKRKLVGLKMLGRGIARHGYDIYDATAKNKIGVVCSGTSSPTLKI